MSAGGGDVTRRGDSLHRGFSTPWGLVAFLVLQVQGPLFHLQHLSIPLETDEKSSLSQFCAWPCLGVISCSSSCLHMQDLSLLVGWNSAWRQVWRVWPQVVPGGLQNEQDNAFVCCANPGFIKKI